MELLDLRRLNRATLARQHLLERTTTPLAQVVAAVGGLQAQLPAPPVIGLWSRVDGFTRETLHAAVRAGALVRGTSLRGTLHLHEVDDYRALRLQLQPIIERVAASHRRSVRAEDLEPALALGAAALAEHPYTVAELRALLAPRFPHSPAASLVNLVRHGLQLLLVPDPNLPDAWHGQAPFVDARVLVGDTLAEEHDGEQGVAVLVRRFLAALGPGTAKDVQTWSGARGAAPVMRRMLDAGELVELVTWEGDAILDLADAPRPSGDAPAAPRLLPMWDNVLLSHANRSRIVHPDWRPYLASKNGMSPPTFLIDGFVHGTWTITRAGAHEVTMALTPFARVPARHEDALVAECERLLAFLHPDATTRRVSFG